MIRRVTTVVVSVLGLSILMRAVGAIAGRRPPAGLPGRHGVDQPGSSAARALMVGADVAASKRRAANPPEHGAPGLVGLGPPGRLCTTQARLTWRPGRPTGVGHRGGPPTGGHRW